MPDPAYPAARSAASLVQPHFALHRGHPPDLEAVEAILDAAFWASLQREEGRAPRISLAFVSPDPAIDPLVFERPIPLAARSLTRVAPAVVRPGIHLGVSREADALHVWGTTRRLPPYTFVLEVIDPGLLVVKHSRGDSGKFVNVAVLEGDSIKVIDQRAAAVPDCPALLISLLGIEAPFAEGPPSILIQLAVSMRAHGRGGSLLVTRSGSDAWRDSILHPITYSVEPPYAALAGLSRDPDDEPDALRRTIDAVAGLTAVDGAVLLNDRYELLAFGAKILRRKGSPAVERIIVTEPVQGSTPEVVEPAQLGGTRHLSAAQFVHDQHDAIALVASQDGRFTVFAWSPCEDMVHGHRIEALLL